MGRRLSGRKKPERQISQLGPAGQREGEGEREEGWEKKKNKKKRERERERVKVAHLNDINEHYLKCTTFKYNTNVHVP